MSFKLFVLSLVCIITGVTAEKIYLPAEQIQVSSQGIFLRDLQGRHTPLSTLSSDEMGVYTLSESFQHTVQCPGCGTRYADNDGPIYCSRRSCPYYGQRIN
jgi:hypothetical protein